MSPGRALLVAGTDTSVGKTVVSSLLLAAWRRRGLRVGAMKPVETGCEPEQPEDALRLAAAAAASAPLDVLCPYRFRLPVAPESAADAEGVTLELPRIGSALAELRQQNELVLVESAGGLGTPYGPGLLVLDLARTLDLPVLLVARHVLGTVGQVLVALRAMEHEGVRCLGVILSQTSAEPPGPAGATHAPLLVAHGRGVPYLGLVPHVAEPAPPAPPAAPYQRWAEQHASLLEENLALDLLQARIAGPRTM